MELEAGIEVREVTFDEFERRKSPRTRISIDEITSKDYFANVSYALERLEFEVDYGIEVNEVTFVQFERRKVPRESRPLNS